MEMRKEIEVSLGVGMNMFFPETIKIVIDEDNNVKEENTNQDDNRRIK